jgi:hypothetical protein
VDKYVEQEGREDGGKRLLIVLEIIRVPILNGILDSWIDVSLDIYAKVLIKTTGYFKDKSYICIPANQIKRECEGKSVLILEVGRDVNYPSPDYRVIKLGLLYSMLSIQ